MTLNTLRLMSSSERNSYFPTINLPFRYKQAPHLINIDKTLIAEDQSPVLTLNRVNVCSNDTTCRFEMIKRKYGTTNVFSLC